MSLLGDPFGLIAGPRAAHIATVMDPIKPRIWQPDACIVALDIDAGDRFVTHAIAGAGSRCIAALVDCVLSALLAVLPVVWLVLPLGLSVPAALTAAGMVVVIVHLLLCWTCEFLFDGQSPGKNICALRVVTLSGTRASFGQITVRNLVRLADLLPGCYLAGLVAMLVSRITRRLGDLAAGTLVIHEEPLSGQLGLAGVPPSVYSTSEDGYLLESFLAREERLDEPLRTMLAQNLATYFVERYPSAAAAVPATLRASDPMAFLRRLHEAEAGAAE